jgi:plastocyanin
LVLAVLIIVIAVLSATVVIQFGGIATPPVGSSTAPSSSTTSSGISRLTTTPILQKSTPTSSSGGSARVLMTYSQYNPSLIATPSATLNYSIGIHKFDPEVSKVALSATSTVPGVTVALTPKEFTFVGEHESIILAISVDQSVNSSNVPIEIIANTSIGSAKFPLTFTLEKGVVVVQTLVNGLLIPTTIHVSVGQTVTWLDVIGVDDDGNGPVNITLKDGSASSPTLVEFDSWKHLFSQPGTYSYTASSIGSPDASGTVVVA